MKNKGITLVAMVVTVVIMIILAGVGINLVAGNKNTVITEAEEYCQESSIWNKIIHIGTSSPYLY